MNAKNVNSNRKTKKNKDNNNASAVIMVIVWLITKVAPVFSLALLWLLERGEFNLRIWLGSAYGLTYVALTQRLNFIGFFIALGCAVMFQNDEPSMFVCIGLIISSLIHSLVNHIYYKRKQEREQNKK